MTTVRFTVEGRPRGKGRPRFISADRPPITPKATREAEAAIKAAYLSAAGPHCDLMTGTVTLSIEAVFRIPSSWPNKLRAAALNGEVEYTGKPDRDNLLKLPMDALNGVAWVDDAQVNRGPIVRRYGYPERTEIVVFETKADAAVKSPAEARRERKVASGDAGKAKPRKARQRACKEPAWPEIGRRIR